MAGLENILNIISSQQKETENAIISAAEKKAAAIKKEGSEKAEKAYEEQLKKMTAKLVQDHENSKASVDADMKRRILACKVKCINDVIEKALKKLDSLSETEYFEVVEKLLSQKVQKDKGVLYFSKRDLGRMPVDFAKKAETIAEKAGGTIRISDICADIENGFILEYGLISENCSFRDIIEAERDAVRDTAARALFG